MASSRVQVHPDEIRSARASLGLTQLEVSDLLGCREVTVGRYERGNQPPPLSALRTLQLEQIHVALTMAEQEALRTMVRTRLGVPDWDPGW
jgi:transcriptional regulator with XRE-family HTH domain